MAQLAAAVMMTMAFRGYLLWVINVAISIYLFTETFKIHDYNKNTVSGSIFLQGLMKDLTA